MAHRSMLDGGSSTSERLGLRLPAIMSFRAALDMKERESIPLHASHMSGHGAEGFIDPLLIAKTRRQYFYRYGLALELATEPLAGGGQPRVARLLTSRACQLFQKRLRRPNPQVGLFCQSQGALPRPL